MVSSILIGWIFPKLLKLLHFVRSLHQRSHKKIWEFWTCHSSLNFEDGPQVLTNLFLSRIWLHLNLELTSLNALFIVGLDYIQVYSLTGFSRNTLYIDCQKSSDWRKNLDSVIVARPLQNCNDNELAGGTKRCSTKAKKLRWLRLNYLQRVSLITSSRRRKNYWRLWNWNMSWVNRRPPRTWPSWWLYSESVWSAGWRDLCISLCDLLPDTPVPTFAKSFCISYLLRVVWFLQLLKEKRKIYTLHTLKLT